MDAPAPHDVTQLLIAWSSGDQAARERLMSVVYDELHRLARRYMRNESPGHTLQTSALVHEAFIRLVDQKNVHWQNRSHFFGIAAQMMRRILVDYARSRNFAKRGGGAVKLSLEEGLIVSDERSEQVVAVHEALEGLAKIDPRQAQIVELKFFGGLSNAETGEVLAVSPGHRCPRLDNGQSLASSRNFKKRLGPLEDLDHFLALSLNGLWVVLHEGSAETSHSPQPLGWG